MPRNRAKCRLCGDVIESFHSTDYIMCKCGEISVADGSALRCGARDYNNFIRIDDNDQEVAVKVKDTNTTYEPIDKPKSLTKSDLMFMLKEMIAHYEGLPQHAMTAPVTHYDMLSVLMLVSALFKDEFTDDC
jgi:hypothetical protein